jgi:hypothetical protein
LAAVIGRTLGEAGPGGHVLGRRRVSGQPSDPPLQELLLAAAGVVVVVVVPVGGDVAPWPSPSLPAAGLPWPASGAGGSGAGGDVVVVVVGGGS